MRRGMGLGILFVLLGWQVLAQSSFSQGEQFFINNRPEEALPFLEAAVAEESYRFPAFLYLGIAYQQLGRYDDAIGLYLQILPNSGEETARVAFNLGNVYFAKGDFLQAQRYYSWALDFDPYYDSAYLNRANTKLNMGSTDEAIADYRRYLALFPTSPKRSQIERLISFINAEAAAEVRRQVFAEAEIQAAQERRELEAREAEEQRLAEVHAEAARLEAQARAEAEQLTAEARRVEEEARLEIARQDAEARAAAIRREAEEEAEAARFAAESAREAADVRRQEQLAREAEAREAAEARRQEQLAREAEARRQAEIRLEQAREATAARQREQAAREAESRRQAEIRAEQAREAAAARQRQQEEQAAEARRQADARAEAERLAAEAERRRQLLEDVAASLQAASEESRGLSAGSDSVQQYSGEFELK